MKKGISIWAFKKISLEEAFKKAAANGFDGVELALDEEGELSLNSTDEELLKIKETAKKAGIELYSLATSLFWKYSLTSNDKQVVDKAKEICRKQLSAAAVLGCDTILILPGLVTADVAYDEAYDRAYKAIKELAPFAEEKGVYIGVENVWNKFMLSPLEMKSFIDSIGSKYVGAYFDVGNVVYEGFPEQWIRILGSRIKKIHVKDFQRGIGNITGFTDLLCGDTDFIAVAKALSDTGYDNWVTAEISPHQIFPEHVLPTTKAALDLIFKK